MESSIFDDSVTLDLSFSSFNSLSTASPQTKEKSEDETFDIHSYFLESSDDEDSPCAESTGEPSLSKPLYDGASLSVLDSYLLLLQYAIRHSLNKKAFSELLLLVGAHLPSTKMISSYKLNKLFTDLFDDIQGRTYYCCSTCHQSLQSVSSVCSNNCESETTDFLIIPLGPQLKRRLEGECCMIITLLQLFNVYITSI